jgi:hypothetical protein
LVRDRIYRVLDGTCFKSVSNIPCWRPSDVFNVEMVSDLGIGVFQNSETDKRQIDSEPGALVSESGIGLARGLDKRADAGVVSLVGDQAGNDCRKKGARTYEEAKACYPILPFPVPLFLGPVLLIFSIPAFVIGMRHNTLLAVASFFGVGLGFAAIEFYFLLRP